MACGGEAASGGTQSLGEGCVKPQANARLSALGSLSGSVCHRVLLGVQDGMLGQMGCET